MGEIMFTDKDFISNSIDIMLKERDYLTKSLSLFKDLTVYNSNGNFILAKIDSKKFSAATLREHLIPKKIIIRDCNSFDGLDEYFFRVCILKPEDNRYLINCLKEYLQ